MKVQRAQLFRYDLPLTSPLPGLGESITRRQGLILRLEAEGGASGYGEAAPLPGFSEERIEESQAVLQQWLPELQGAEVPIKPVEIAGGEETWNTVPASAQFALSTAVAMLKSRKQGADLREPFGKNQRDRVPLNALVLGGPGEAADSAREAVQNGYRAIKLKIGRGDISQDVETVRAVHGAIGEGASLRLDANRAWNYREAELFARGVRGIPIEYIEEPLEYWKLLFTYRLYTRLEYAVDETLLLYRNMVRGEFPANDDPPLTTDELWDNEQRQHLRHVVKRAKAHIIKPTLFGGLRDVSVFVDAAAQDWSSTPVFSSSFESGLGLLLIANAASVTDPHGTPIGLDTLRWFAEDVLPGPLPIANGHLDLAGANAMLADLDLSRLEEVGTAR